MIINKKMNILHHSLKIKICNKATIKTEFLSLKRMDKDCKFQENTYTNTQDNAKIT